jgi:hypothetical protein
MKRLWMLFLARFRLNLKAVCEMSKDRGPYVDYHDYPDSADCLPIHFEEMTCVRCGKKFFI